MFHIGKGLHFERTPKGDVRIVRTYDGRAPRVDNVVLDQTLTAEDFASVMANLSRRGESPHTHREALGYLNAGG